MMWAAEPWHRYKPVTHSGVSHRCAAPRSSLVQPEMRGVVAVVADVLVHPALQMALIENDHMIEQVAPATTDEAFRNAILPRTSETGSFRLDAEALQRVNNFGTETGTLVEDKVPQPS